MLFDEPAAEDERGGEDPVGNTSRCRKARAKLLEREIMPHEDKVRRALHGKYSDLDLDEVIQAAYLRMMVAKEISGVQNAGAYFYRVAKSEVLDRLRRSQTSPSDFVGLEDVELIADQPLADDVFDGKRALEDFHAAMAQLNPRQQEVIRLRYFDQLGPRAIADRMALSLSAIEKHQRFGTRALKALMGQS